MNVLFITPDVTINDIPEFTRNQTGFGYMVYDIAKGIAATEPVDVLVTHHRYKEFRRGNVRFVGISIGLLIAYFFKVSSLRVVLRLFKNYTIRLPEKIKLLYQWFSTGYFFHLIKKNNYDIIHIHGCTFADEFWLDVCKRADKPFLITLHGLNSFSETTMLGESGKKYERDFLRRASEESYQLSVISTGIKKTIEKYVGKGEMQNISVVTNCFSFNNNSSQQIVDIRKKYNIPQSAALILYVGNMGYNKNQSQLVDSFGLMSRSICESTWALFLGHPDPSYSIEPNINASNFKEHFIICGSINKENISDYYQQCDGVVLLSFCEGFGLSLIEGMSYGKPCMAFSDMDAFEDIYDPNVMVPLYDRSNSTVATGLEQLLTNTWNEDLIKARAKLFEIDIMADKYIKLYKKVIDEY